MKCLPTRETRAAEAGGSAVPLAQPCSVEGRSGEGCGSCTDIRWGTEGYVVIMQPPVQPLSRLSEKYWGILETCCLYPRATEHCWRGVVELEGWIGALGWSREQHCPWAQLRGCFASDLRFTWLWRPVVCRDDVLSQSPFQLLRASSQSKGRTWGARLLPCGPRAMQPPLTW